MGSNIDPKPFVSVIIPVYRNPDGLRTCLDALEQQSYPRERFEVIVVDNGGNGDLDALASVEVNVVLCHEPAPGSYAARNAGIGRARGQLLAFTDSDCVPDENWLLAGVDSLGREPRPDMIGGSIKVFARTEHPLGIFETYQVVKGFYAETQIRDDARASTANLIARREVFEKIGLFRADFQSQGDNEWTRRAVRNGYSIKYTPDAIVLHAARHEFLDFSLRYVRTTGGYFDRARVEGAAPLSFSKVMGYLRPPFGETRRNKGHPALQVPFGRTKFFLAEYWVRAIRLLETTRLLLGGRPIRY